MAPRSASEWRRHPEIVEASVRGFNYQDDFPRIISKEHPWLKEFDLGFCDDEDLPSWIVFGWDHLRPGDFDVENYNSAVGLRYGLSDAGGHLKLGNNYIMIISKELNEKRAKARARAAQEAFKSGAESRRYVAPEDPRGQEFLDDDDAVMAKLEHQTIAPTSAKPKRVGRPPKR